MRMRHRHRPSTSQALVSNSCHHVCRTEPRTLDAKVLETAADIHVSNDQGDEVRFGDIFTDSKTVIVFIRARTLPILYVLIYNPT
jgi:hypothetical protein